MGERLMAGEVHEISSAIGRLEGQMEILSEAFKASLEETRKEHRKVHDIVQATSEAMRVVASKVDKMEPITRDYEVERAEKRGAAKLVKGMYLVISVVGGYAAFWSAKAVEWMSMKPPTPHP